MGALTARTAGLLRVRSTALIAAFEDERSQWVLWLPVFFGSGIALYFALPQEPPAWPAATALLAFGVLFWRVAPHKRLVLLPLLALVAGFTVVQARTAMVAAPVLSSRHGPVELEGRLISVEPLGQGMRLLLDHPRIERLSQAATPARVRLVWRGETAEQSLHPGDRINLLAVLLPPPRPAAPGAFDFARAAYFERLGAVGYALRMPRLVASAPALGPLDAWKLWWESARSRLATRIRSVLPGETGAVAAALMTGQRGAIPEDVLQAMRNSGLAHLLAISGLHLGLVAGLVFAALRAALALVPFLALRWPIKKWAAGCGLLAASGYLFLVGAPVPTQRAFLMVGIVLIAVIFDRTAISLRLVAFAAFLVLLLTPESLLGASFQMSFAAVIALVAAFERLRLDLGGRLGEGPSRRLGFYLWSLALTSLIAVAATAPLAAFHFNRVSSFGLLANLVAVPLTAFWIMAWALLAYLLWAFGLEALALVPMGWGIDLLLAVARAVSGWPGAVILVPAQPVWLLALMAVGGLWLCLWRGPWRRWGLLLVVLTLLLVPLRRGPDLLINEEANLWGLRTPEGRIALSSLRKDRHSAGIWLRREGQAHAERLDFRGSAEPASPWFACDALGCSYRRAGFEVSLIEDGRALPEDCRRADLLISAIPLRSLPCPAPRAP